MVHIILVTVTCGQWSVVPAQAGTGASASQHCRGCRLHILNLASYSILNLAARFYTMILCGGIDNRPRLSVGTLRCETSIIDRQQRASEPPRHNTVCLISCFHVIVFILVFWLKLQYCQAHLIF